MGTSANPTAAGSGEGTPPTGGQPAGAGAGGGNGGAGSGAPNAGAAGASTTLDRQALNPLLRGLEADQINDVFETLLANARTSNTNGQPAVPPPPPKAPTRDELKDAFDPSSDKFDPEKAIADLVQRNYGGLIADIGRNSLFGMTSALKSAFPDIDDYSREMQVILQNKSPQTTTREDLIAAYYMAKGAVQTKKEIEARNKPASTIPPSTQEDKEEAEKNKISPVEEEMARIMFRGSKDPVADYKRGLKLVDGDFEIRVPGDPPREPAKK